MKTGMTLPELAVELKSQQDRKRDLVVDSRMLTMLTSTDQPSELHIPDEAPLAPSDLFHRQLGTHLQIRSDFYDRLRGKHAGLFDHLVNGLLREEPSRRLLRTYSDGGPDGLGIARAFLSERYLRIDNHDLAQIAVPIIGELPGARIDSCNLSEQKMYLKVVVPNGGIDLNQYREGVDWQALRAQYGAHHMFKEGEGPDFVQPGFVIENSEVGAGALRVSQLMFRVRCSNGLIMAHTVQRRHVGTIIGGEDEGTIYQADTVQAIDNAIRLKVRDAIKATVDETNFELLARQFAEAGMTRPVERPIEAMKVLVKETAITEREGEDVLEFLIAGGDYTKFGAINAITAAAQGVESFDRSIELETLASELLNWSPREWDRVAVAA